ncbi:putative CRM domain-containing protein [Senna tora]|uniref:Putative CRM domain-containing protein n=1 Tax=Senna tora TaxID=362788 RepID=A0A834WD90_9FABA|nr:putative CRM domain-containing protein [Senna tora]
MGKEKKETEPVSVGIKTENYDGIGNPRSYESEIHNKPKWDTKQTRLQRRLSGEEWEKRRSYHFTSEYFVEGKRFSYCPTSYKPLPPEEVGLNSETQSSGTDGLAESSFIPSDVRKWQSSEVRKRKDCIDHWADSTFTSLPSSSMEMAEARRKQACGLESSFGYHYNKKRSPFLGHLCIHSGPFLKSNDTVVEPPQDSEKSPTPDGAGNASVKRKKLKGKRAVARKKEERLLEALKKIEPAESLETTHDPEILTPEEHFFFLKMGLKCKNYVPVGRRGIYQGVILNMHLHWKKHQTLKVVVKTFSAEEVKEIAAELARLTGGIVLDIHEENTIIMYRGKNYSQPPTEIMSPRVTLSRKKVMVSSVQFLALDKSKYKDGLRAVRRYIPRLEQELELLRAQLKSKAESKIDGAEENQKMNKDSIEASGISEFLLENANAEKLNECPEDEADMDSEWDSDSEDLSDIFEIDSDTDNEVKEEQPLYLDKFENFPAQSDREFDDFEEHLRQISFNSKNSNSMEKDVHSPKFDEVDQIVLRAASLLKKRK